MKKSLSLPAKIVLQTLAVLTLTVAASAQAASLGDRLRTSVNTMVQNVHATQDPAVKRAIMGEFLNRMDRGLGIAKHAVSEKAQPRVDLMRADVQAKYAELNGLNGSPKVADIDLDHYADYIQQDMEQAAVYVEEGYYYYWGGGAFFILFLILLIVLAEGPYG